MKAAAAQITEPALPKAKAKRRHGSERRKRHSIIPVRSLPEQKERLKIQAAAAAMSVSAWLLSGRLGDDAVPVYRYRLPKIEAQAVARNNAELNCLGNNANQIARGVNQLLPIAREMGAERLEQILTDVRELQRALVADIARTLAANRDALGHDSEM
jgi:hypothetical protein